MWQGHGMIYVAKPQVDIRGCDHLISPMSTNIVETTMAVGIRWKGASRLLLRGNSDQPSVYSSAPIAHSG
ncbi:Uncharacterized protein TCM_010023 [Theobroma cacao]|uniref:Uncharacterized protein n=1 Tax=Theobroma cacao TaxID=3641 RepID=A0A061E6J2_THECC|nr:Uncharacterized protein TCM_010023 [Theobroma cacao]